MRILGTCIFEKKKIPSENIKHFEYGDKSYKTRNTDTSSLLPTNLCRNFNARQTLL